MYPSFIITILSTILLLSNNASPNKTEGRFQHSKSSLSIDHWGYDVDDGPDEWCETIPACCGLHQSPINLNDAQSSRVEYSNFVLTKYDLRRNILLTNNGHTVVVKLSDGLGAPTISGGHLQGVYVLDSMHFHWGHNDTVGSEHTISGFHYPLEGHLVHFNSKYTTLHEAMEHADGVAVLAALFKVTCLNNSDIAPVINALKYVGHKEESALAPDSIVLRKFLPEDLKSFYRYRGSLTTPPCSEVVTWTIFDHPVGISERQLQEFRQDIHSHKMQYGGKPDPLLEDNFRETQNSKQKVFRNHYISNDEILPAEIIDCKNSHRK